MHAIRQWTDQHPTLTAASLLAAALLLLGASALLIMALLRSAPQTASASPTPTVPGQASGLASGTPSASTSGTPPPLIQETSAFGAVVLVDGLRVRATAATGAAVGSLASGDIVVISQGPQSVDGQDWYEVSATNELHGWVSAGPSAGPFLELHHRVAAELPAMVDDLMGGPDGYVALGSASHGSGDAAPRFVIASADGATWTYGSMPAGATRAQRLEVADGPVGWVAVAPDAAATRVAGIWRSADGLAWQSVDASFEAGFLPEALSASTSVYALTMTDARSGTGHPALFTSTDGSSWQQVSLPTALASLTVVPEGAGLLALTEAADGRVTVRSTHDGSTWTTLTDAGATALPATPQRVARLGTGLVATTIDQAKASLAIWTATVSGGSVTWVRRAAAESQLAGVSLGELLAVGDSAVAVGHRFEDGQLQLWSTTDGATWTRKDAAALETGGGIGLVASGKAGLVATGDHVTAAGPNPVLWHSASGSAWQAEADPVLATVTHALDGACPAQPATMLDWLAIPGAVGAECFGDAPISFRAWLTAGPGCGGLAPGLWEPPWLANPFALLGIVLTPFEAHYGVDCGSAAQHPDLSTLPAEQQWLQVTGHWADSAAADCRYRPDPSYPGSDVGAIPEADVIFRCSTTFVVTELRPER